MQSTSGVAVSAWVISDALAVLPIPGLAEAEHVAALVSELIGQLRATRKRLLALRRAHRRFGEVVARSSVDLGVDQRVAAAEIVRHAGVDDLEREAVGVNKNVDRRAAGKKVLDHLQLTSCGNAETPALAAP